MKINNPDKPWQLIDVLGFWNYWANNEAWKSTNRTDTKHHKID